MKKILLSIGFILTGGFLFAQGLENIIVEKYYVSDANDTIANPDGGVLPVGSVTYRIYADMLPGYRFQAAYGVPGHEMRIATTTLFFNNEDRGATSPTYTKTQASHNTVMLDSWLSVGAACAGNYGVMKSIDDGFGTVVNTYIPQVLQNADPDAGIPLTTQDGFIAGTPEPVVTVGITNEISVFDNQNDGTNGPVFSTSNGSWASLYGSVGPDTIENKVLIAQITTDGDFSFKLNVQIGTPSHQAENYVAENPVANEIQMSSLIYSSLTTSSHNLASKSTAAVFSVYPNPSRNSVTIDINSPDQSSNNSFTIYSPQGSSIFHKELGTLQGKHLEQVDISGLAKGFYILEVLLNGMRSSKQLVIN